MKRFIVNHPWFENPSNLLLWVWKQNSRFYAKLKLNTWILRPPVIFRIWWKRMLSIHEFFKMLRNKKSRNKRLPAFVWLISKPFAWKTLLKLRTHRQVFIPNANKEPESFNCFVDLWLQDSASSAVYEAQGKTHNCRFDQTASKTNIPAIKQNPKTLSEDKRDANLFRSCLI